MEAVAKDPRCGPDLWPRTPPLITSLRLLDRLWRSNCWINLHPPAQRLRFFFWKMNFDPGGLRRDQTSISGLLPGLVRRSRVHPPGRRLLRPRPRLPPHWTAQLEDKRMSDSDREERKRSAILTGFAGILPGLPRMEAKNSRPLRHLLLSELPPLLPLLLPQVIPVVAAGGRPCPPTGRCPGWGRRGDGGSAVAGWWFGFGPVGRQEVFFWWLTGGGWRWILLLLLQVTTGDSSVALRETNDLINGSVCTCDVSLFLLKNYMFHPELSWVGLNICEAFDFYPLISWGLWSWKHQTPSMLFSSELRQRVQRLHRDALIRRLGSCKKKKVKGKF